MSTPRDTSDTSGRKKKVRFNPYEERDDPPAYDSPVQQQKPEEPAAEAEAPQAEPANEAPPPEAPQATAHVHEDMESPVTPQGRTEAAILVLEDNKFERRFWSDFCFWAGCVLAFLFLTSVLFMALAPEPRRQRIVVQVPEDAGVVTVAPGRSAWDQPQVVAVYRRKRAPEQAKEVVVHERVIVKDRTPKQKIVRRDINA